MNDQSNSSDNLSNNAAMIVMASILKNKLSSTILIISVFIIAASLAYLLFRETMSEQSRQLAEAGKLMSESLKANSETLAPVPSIVKGFSDLIDDRVSIIFEQRASQISGNINQRIEDALNKVRESQLKIDNTAREIRSLSLELDEIKKKADESLQELNDKAKQLNLLFPQAEKYKNVVDPEYLARMLHQEKEWIAGADIVIRFENLVSASKDSPEKLPAKYIEVVGDWCRERNQHHLALWFYENAVERDPERLSAVVELHSLRAEVLPKKREDSLAELNELSLSGKLDFSQIRRIFNVFIELDRYKELSELTKQLENIEKYTRRPDNFASLLRNRAVSLEKYLGHKSPEAWLALEKAVSLSEDENVLRIYARWLYETKQYPKAEESLLKLLVMDPRDSSYYIILTKTYLERGDIKKAEKVILLAEQSVTDPSSQLEVIAFKVKLPSGTTSEIKQYLDGVIPLKDLMITPDLP